MAGGSFEPDLGVRTRKSGSQAVRQSGSQAVNRDASPTARLPDCPTARLPYRGGTVSVRLYFASSVLADLAAARNVFASVRSRGIERRTSAYCR